MSVVSGHFGENGIYEGVKKIRSGYLDYFKEMDYQKSMVSQARERRVLTAVAGDGQLNNIN